MEQIYESDYSGQEVDAAVGAARSGIPQQITQINTRVTALEEDVDDLSGLPQQVATIGLELGDIHNMVYGSDEEINETIVRGINLPVDGTEFISSNSHHTYYIPISIGYTYTITLDRTSASTTVSARISICSETPASGVETNYLTNLTVDGGKTASYSILSTESGYLAVSVWGSDFTSNTILFNAQTDGVNKSIAEINSNLEGIDSKLNKYDTALSYTDKTPVKTVTFGTMYRGEIKTDTLSNLCDSYFYEIPIGSNGQAVRIYHGNGITIRVSEYDSNKSYLHSVGYLDTESYTIVNAQANYLRIAAAYPSDRYSGKSKIEVSDFEYGDFGFYLGGSDEILDLKESIKSINKAVDNISTEVATINDDISELNLNTFGGTKITSFTTQLNLRPDSSGVFTAVGHTNRYFGVKKGCSYIITVDSTELESSYAIYMGYSDTVPVLGGTVTGFFQQSTTIGEILRIKITSEIDGYFSFGIWKTVTDDVFSVSEIYYSIEEKVHESTEQSIADAVKKTGNGMSIYMGKESLVLDGNTVKLEQVTAVPYDSAELSISCPNNIVVWFELILEPNNATTTLTQYYGNKDTLILDSGYNSYKIYFAYGEKKDGSYSLTGDAITVDEIAAMINDGTIRITFDDYSPIINNKDCEKLARAIVSDGLPCFSHISDVHGDAIRYDNFMQISEYYGVTAAINTGDNVSVGPGDKMTFLKNSISQHPNVTQIACMGNHDNYWSDSSNYTNFYKIFDDAFNYEMSDANTYYYKDFPDYRIRFIVINIYEERCIGYSCQISQNQIEWFISTLQSTPENYGVFVVAHCSEKWIEPVNGKDNFYDRSASSDWTNVYPNITGYPISSIVDAFISKTTVNGSYSQVVHSGASTTDEITENVEYSADFTSLNSGVEFIAYINGHKHNDQIGYLSDTINIQLCLNIVQGAASKYYNYNDIPRGNGKGSVQDAINLYCIDRDNGVVRIVRIGSNTTYNLVERDKLIIPYK